MAILPASPNTPRIATDLNDFRNHTDGTNFNHAANQITNSPGVGGASNIQGSINNINSFIELMAAKGIGYATIPDGYNSYTYPSAGVYFNNTIPSLSDFLIPLFNNIISGSPVPSNYQRISKGGVLFIPSGTYYVTNTITVPPGIILLGEGYATKIINATSLNLTSVPVDLNSIPTPAPVFKIASDPNRSLFTANDIAVDVNNMFMFGRSTKFIGITIGDNFIEKTTSTDSLYLKAQNKTGDNPLIMQLQGSNFEMHNVYIIGRANTTGTVVNGATRFAVKLDTTTSISGSMLTMDGCFIDGFSQPVCFESSFGVEDYLTITNCKIRSHGYLNGINNTEQNNCIIFANNGNARIINNNFYGNHQLCNTALFINNTIASPPVLNSRSNILVASNEFMIDKTSNIVNPGFAAAFYYVKVSIRGSFTDYSFIQSYGNQSNIESGFNIVQGDFGNNPHNRLTIADNATLSANTNIDISAGGTIYNSSSDIVINTSNSASITAPNGISITGPISGTLNITNYPSFIASKSYSRLFGLGSTQQLFASAGVIFPWEVSTTAISKTDSSSFQTTKLFVTIPTHNTATLSSIDVYYKIGSLNFPGVGNKLSFNIIRTNITTSSSDNLISLPVSVAGTNASTYFNSGSLTTLNIPITQFASIDSNTYLYYIFCNAEYGANATADNNIIYGFKAYYTGVSDLQAP